MKCIDCDAYEYVGQCPHCDGDVYICADGEGIIKEAEDNEACDGVVWGD